MPPVSPNDSSHPIRDLSQYDNTTLVPAIDALLADAQAVLTRPLGDLLAYFDGRQIGAMVNSQLEESAPKRLAYAADVLAKIGSPKTGMMMFGPFVGIFFSQWNYQRKRNTLLGLLDQYELRRPVITLTDQEKALFRAVGHLVANRAYDPEQWSRFMAMLVWNPETYNIVPVGRLVGHREAPTVHKAVCDILKDRLPKREHVLAQAMADVARYIAKGHAVDPGLAKAISEGSRWMTAADISSSPVYSFTKDPRSLVIGYEQVTGRPVYFNGHESLITIAGPGAGKSSTQVIPNLLRYKGSAIVLDVKGELWRETAGYRAKNVGPVYRFAPSDPDWRSHRFNPFDLISRDPNEAANDCSVFSYQVIAENPNQHDPYWENRGRDLLWAFAMMIAVKGKRSRNLEGLAKLINLPLDKKPDSDIMQILAAMRKIGQDHNVPDLVAAANSMSNGMGQPRLDSTLDSARRYLSIFGRADNVRAAMSATDWRPQDFRKAPAPTLYICLDPTEIKVFAPIVRLLITQHIRILQKQTASSSDLPVTLFLDEMPQLGNFDTVLQVQAVGRGAGLRLWMFAQDVSQLSTAFGRDRYQGVINSCRVRCFMQPDAEGAELLAPALGETQNLFNGEKRPLATPHELMGRTFADKIVVTTRGDDPMSLAKRYWFDHDKQRVSPPPRVPKAVVPP